MLHFLLTTSHTLAAQSYQSYQAMLSYQLLAHQDTLNGLHNQQARALTLHTPTWTDVPAPQGLTSTCHFNQLQPWYFRPSRPFNPSQHSQHHPTTTNIHQAIQPAPTTVSGTLPLCPNGPNSRPFQIHLFHHLLLLRYFHFFLLLFFVVNNQSAFCPFYIFPAFYLTSSFFASQRTCCC